MFIHRRAIDEVYEGTTSLSPTLQQIYAMVRVYGRILILPCALNFLTTASFKEEEGEGWNIYPARDRWACWLLWGIYPMEEDPLNGYLQKIFGEISSSRKGTNRPRHPRQGEEMESWIILSWIFCRSPFNISLSLVSLILSLIPHCMLLWTLPLFILLFIAIALFILLFIAIVY